MKKKNIIQLVSTPQAPKIERPSYRVYNQPVTINGQHFSPGVWFHTGEDSKAEDYWLSGPLHVEAITHNEQKNNDYGRLLALCNLDGKWLNWAMPSHLLVCNANEVLATLSSMGLSINHARQHQIIAYISSVLPKERFIATSSTGWHGSGLFVLPSHCIGEGNVVFQSETQGRHNYGKGGSLEDWKHNIGRLCPGNPILMLGVCAALAGPLLHHIPRNGGGFHIVGDSSTGKSTALLAGASVWGNGEKFTHTWSATTNGIEAIASERNDTLLVLDEISQANPKAVGSIIYSIANGVGKARAQRTGTAKPAKHWRVILLSSGELKLDTLMAEDAQKARAGQDVRMVEVSARRQYGAWDELHGYSDGSSFSEAVQHASVTHFGHAGPAFIQKLLETQQLDSLPELLNSTIESFPSHNGQTARVAQLFALTAMAGELAIKFGLLPALPGQALSAIEVLYEEWKAARGTAPKEEQIILQCIADFIAKHGGSRFQSEHSSSGAPSNCAGLLVEQPFGSAYLFYRHALQEAAPGYDLLRICQALEQAGAFVKRESGKYQAQKRLPGNSQRKERFYWINPERLQIEE